MFLASLEYLTTKTWCSAIDCDWNQIENPPWLEYVKIICSSVVIMLSTITVFYGMCVGLTSLQLNPFILFTIMICSMSLVAYCMILQIGLVAVEKWDMRLFQSQFPRAYKCWLRAPGPTTLKQFLMGRELFLMLNVYIIAQCTLLSRAPDNWLGLSNIFTQIFVTSGIPTVLIVVNICQLLPQFITEEFTLPSMNLVGNGLIIDICFAIEFIGFNHFSWLLYHTISGMICSRIREAQVNRQVEGLDNQDVLVPEQIERIELSGAWDLFRYSWSTFMTISSLFIIILGISRGYAMLNAPIYLCYIVFILSLLLLFYLEGLIVSVVSTQCWEREIFIDIYPRAYAVHELVNRPNNMKRFLAGRQFLGVLVTIMLARVTTFLKWEGQGWNTFGFYLIIKSGLVGMLTAISLAQLCPELLAAEFPLRFMNMYGTMTIIRISLFIEALGLGHCAWLLFYLVRQLACISYKNIVEETKPRLMRVRSDEFISYLNREDRRLSVILRKLTEINDTALIQS